MREIAFWGLQVQPGKTYTQIVEDSYRVTMAALPEDCKGNGRVSLYVKVEEKDDFVLCSLVPNKIEQQPLDITFVSGDQITFFVKGDHSVHLTGNHVEEEEHEGDLPYTSDDEKSDEESIEIDEEELIKKFPNEEDRAKILAYLNGSLVLDDDEDDDEEDEEDDEEDEEDDEEDEEEDEEKENEDEDEDEEDEDEEDAMEEEPVKVTKEKASKKDAKNNKESNTTDSKAQKRGAEVEKKQPEAKKQKTEPAAKPKPQVVKMPNGLIVQDIKEGSGPCVKRGQKVGMRYIGKLGNGKVFDKNVAGKPFRFSLGRGEVIKGWDEGIVGMKLGGERKLTIPAALAYGKRGAPPQIPPNATLHFEIKLIAMN